MARLFQLIKTSLAPSTAFTAVQAYMAGKYEKSLRWFNRAERWSPGVIEGEPPFQAFFGLAHFHLGHQEEAARILSSAILRLDSYPDPKVSPEFLASIKAEVQKALHFLPPNH